MRTTVILVADEDESLARAIVTECWSEGWQAFAVSTGDQAIKFVHERKPDLVVLNAVMPGISGIEVCRHISAISKTPIIMLSSIDDAKIRAKCIKSGASDYIVKPFRAVDLTQRIMKALIRRRVNRIAQHPTLAEKRKSLQECIDGLRAKIERDPENPSFIVTVPGVGYRFGGEPGTQKS